MSRRRARWSRRQPTASLAAGLLLIGAALGFTVGDAAEAGERVQGRSRGTPRSVARVELGRRLFFDPQVSLSGQRSCASCHAPDHGFSDPDRGSTDDTGTTPRHSQTLLDSAYNPSAHWDGEFTCVEELVTRRLSSPVLYYGAGSARPGTVTPGTVTPGTVTPGTATPGLFRPSTGPRRSSPRRFQREKFPQARASSSVVVRRLNHGRRYDRGFALAFGDKEATLERLALAIAAYCYSIESTTAPFDHFRAGNSEALSASAQRGLKLFEGRARCSACHASEGRHPLFTDYKFHNTGIAWAMPLSVGAVAATPLTGLRRELTLRGAAHPDPGRQRISQRDAELRAFKTPTLRDVALRAPYMHDGRLETLEEVVRYYAEGCGGGSEEEGSVRLGDPKRSALLQSFRASDADIEDLVAFLESLTGEKRPGRAKRAWSGRASVTRLKFIDATGEPMVGVSVKLVPVGGASAAGTVPAEDVLERTTDKRGIIRYRPGSRTHMRVVLPQQPEITDGALVPDTCSRATIRVPVLGRMTFEVTFLAGTTPPPVLIAMSPPGAARIRAGRASRGRTKDRSVPFFPSPIPVIPARAVFALSEVATDADACVARYVGWVYEERPFRFTLRMPGLARRKLDKPISGEQLKPGAVRRLDLRRTR